MDQNNPARFLDTAYNALKSNPGATNQIVQAAARGAPVGLRGLAAAAAQQSQQQAQQAMLAQQAAQGPKPTVMQQLAAANAPGIMGQLPSSIQLASAPTEQAPQMMAGGGLVAFAEGGGVLPPDVLEAIQSHFADGGEVRGFAEGDEVLDAIRNYFAGGRKPRYTVQSDVMKEAYANSPYMQAKRVAEEAAAKAEAFPYDEYAIPESAAPKAPAGTPSSLQLRGQGYTPPEISAWTGEAEGGLGKLTELLGKAKSATGPYMQALRDVSPYAMLLDPRISSAVGMNVEAAKKIAGMDSNLPQAIIEAAESHRQKSPSEIAGEMGLDTLVNKFRSKPASTETTGAIDYDLSKATPAKESSVEKAVRTSFENPEKSTWRPEAHDGHEVNPHARVPVEAQKVTAPFNESKTDVPSAAVKPDSENQGLGGLDQGKEAVDYIKGLLGEKKMSPEISQKLADLEDKARTSTIIQSVLGGLAGGLSNPYGGRFALGSAALNALAGYQKGVSSEEDMARKAFDIERAYADQPADVQTAAAKELFDLAKEKAKMQSAERISSDKLSQMMERLLYTEAGKDTRAQLVAGQKGAVTEGQKIAAWNEATKQATKEIEAEYLGTTPPAGELERRTQQKYQAALNSLLTNTGEGLGVGQAQQQQYGLGAQPQGRSFIGGKLTGSSPQ